MEMKTQTGFTSGTAAPEAVRLTDGRCHPAHPTFAVLI